MLANQRRLSVEKSAAHFIITEQRTSLEGEGTARIRFLMLRYPKRMAGLDFEVGRVDNWG